MRTSLRMTLCLATLVIGLAHAPASADYTVQGRFLYTDKEFDLSGFTGTQIDLPIREADVEVIDANTQAVLATGATDANGEFTLNVIDNQTRNITVRALTSSTQTGDLHVRVVNAGTQVYAVAHPTFSNHAPTTNIDFRASPIVAPPSTWPGNPQPGDPFNIFDVTLDALNFIASVNGARPGAGNLLTVRWYLNSSDGTYYNDASITIALFGLSSDSDGYDDSVIQHEVGHYAEFRLADSDNPGGFHQIDKCYGLPLAWSEGWATFFQNMVRDWRGLSRPDIYVDTFGSIGVLSYSVETLGFPVEAGSGNEASVNAALWDAVDRPTTADATPGVDDDTINLPDGASRAWDVSVNYLTTVTNIQVEKWWDGWFARGHGEQTGMQNAFSVYRMLFFDDAYEPDDSFGTAREGGIANGTTDHTLYGVGDQDWTKYDGVAGGTYRFTIRGAAGVPDTLLDCGVSTSMSLFDSNGTTLLITNPTSITWGATKNGPLYLRVTRPGGDAYGNYKLLVDISVPVVLTDVQITSGAEGVALSWHAEQSGAFSHFHVERSAAADGPYERRTSAPLQDAPQGDYSFVDVDVMAGSTWFYRIVGFEETGESEAFGPYEVTVQAFAPARLALHPARPNPFNPNTTLSFDLPQAGPVFVRVFAVDGRRVRTLLAGQHVQAGTRDVVWDGRDDSGRPAASGLYIVRLESQGRSATQRAVLVR